MKTRNITPSLSDDDIRKARIMAAQRGTSISRMLADLLREVIDRETGYSAARERHLATMETGWNLGTKGRIDWTRDEIHER